LARVRPARSFTARARPRKFFSSAALITGTMSPLSAATAIPRLMKFFRMILSPSMELFTRGYF